MLLVRIAYPTKAIDRKASGSSKGGFGGGLKLGTGFLGGGLGKGPDVPLEFVPLLKTHKEIRDKASTIAIATGTAKNEFHKQFDVEHLPAPPVYAARLSTLLKTLDTADNAVKGAIEARKSHIRNIERLLEQSKTALAKDEQVAADIAAKRAKTEETKASVENLIMKDLEENASTEGGSRTPREESPDGLQSPEIEALTPPAQIIHEPKAPTPASELHHRHSIAPTPPPYLAEFHAGASELLASLAAPLNNSSGLKRSPSDEVGMFEGIDEDLVNMFKKEGAQQQKRQKFEPQDDDEYVP